MTVSINTSFSASLREKLGEERLIGMIAAAGFDAIELSLDRLSDDESIWNRVGHKEYAQRLKAAALAAGIRFNQAHAPSQFDWMARDTDVLNAMVYPTMEKAFEICGILEIPCMVIEPLTHPMALGLPSRRTSWNTTFFKTLAQMGEKYGVRIAIKNLMRSFERGEELKSIIEAVGDDWQSILEALADIGYDGDFTIQASSHDTGALDDKHGFDVDFLPCVLGFACDACKHLAQRLETLKAQRT